MKSNTVPFGPNAKLHDEALKYLVTLKPTKSEGESKAVVSDYNKRRIEATAKLKPILVQIDEAFQRGEKVYDHGSMKSWCKAHGLMTYARVRQIITGKSGNEGKVKSATSLDLTEGTVRSIGGVEYEIGGAPRRSAKSVGGYYTFTFSAKLIDVPPVVTPTPTPITKQSQQAPEITPDQIAITLTKPQMREVELIPRKGVVRVKNELRFPATAIRGKRKNWWPLWKRRVRHTQMK